MARLVRFEITISPLSPGPTLTTVRVDYAHGDVVETQVEAASMLALKGEPQRFVGLIGGDDHDAELLLQQITVGVRHAIRPVPSDSRRVQLEAPLERPSVESADVGAVSVEDLGAKRVDRRSRLLEARFDRDVGALEVDRAGEPGVRLVEAS